MEYKIYYTKHQTDCKIWLEIINSLEKKMRDVYFFPEYIDLNIKDHKSEDGLMFFVKDEKNIWLNCFIKKKIKNCDKIFSDQLYFDLETPYGYGGPLSNTDDEKFLKKAQDLFFKWATKNNIVCQFVRFHPLIGNIKYFKNLDKIILERQNCYTKISYIKENLQSFKPSVRNKIRKAFKNKLTIKISTEKEEFENFKKLYFNHLHKIKAKKFYYFNEDYFLKLYNFISNYGFIVSVNNEKQNTLGSSLFFGNENYLHYHLTAISKKNEFPGINNYLLFNAYIEAKEKKFKLCNLGGGLTNKYDDPLLEFKKNMSNEINDFYIGFKIFNNDIYKKIITFYKLYYPKHYEQNKSKVLFYHIND